MTDRDRTLPDWSELETTLAQHPCADTREREDADRIRSFVYAHPRDAHLRSQRLGHLTGSSFVLDASREHVLLLHHAKLDRWLQPGGHGEGEFEPRAIALRELLEETGLGADQLRAARPAGAPADEALLFDVDIHPIPARQGEPWHEHLDLRYAFVAGAGAAPRLSDESRALRWWPLDAPPEGADPAMRRAFAKLRALPREA